MRNLNSIPLNQDILKKFGFNKMENIQYGLFELILEEERKRIRSNHTFIEIYSTSSSERQVRLHSIQFHVGDLLAAMRLCGLCEWAEKFEQITERYEKDLNSVENCPAVDRDGH